MYLHRKPIAPDPDPERRRQTSGEAASMTRVSAASVQSAELRGRGRSRARLPRPRSGPVWSRLGRGLDRAVGGVPFWVTFAQYNQYTTRLITVSPLISESNAHRFFFSMSTRIRYQSIRLSVCTPALRSCTPLALHPEPARRPSARVRATPSNRYRSLGCVRLPAGKNTNSTEYGSRAVHRSPTIGWTVTMLNAPNANVQH